MDFEKWVYQACNIKVTRLKKDITDIYSSVILNDAKLYFTDGISSEEYSYLI